MEARTTLGLKISVTGIADDHRIAACGVGAAKDRAEVARLLDRLDHEQKRICGSGLCPTSALSATGVGDKPRPSTGSRSARVFFHCGSDGQQPVRAARGTPPWQRHPLINSKTCAPAAVGLGDQRRLVSRPKTIRARCSSSCQFRPAFLERTPDLAVALDEKHPRLVARTPVAQLHELLYARILETGDFFGRQPTAETSPRNPRKHTKEKNRRFGFLGPSNVYVLVCLCG